MGAIKDSFKKSWATIDKFIKIIDNDKATINLVFWATKSLRIKLNRIVSSNLKLKKVDFSGVDLSGNNFSGVDLRGANLSGVHLIEADLSRADLSGADLSRADLSGANLTETNLERANLTGIIFERVITFGWKIGEVKCDYIFLNSGRNLRSPKDRNFQPREFERLYASYPTIEYVFEQGAQWLDLMSFNYSYAKIKEKHPEYDLKSITFDDKSILPRVLISTPNVAMEKDILATVVAGYQEALIRAKDEIMFLRELVVTKTPSISIAQVEGQLNILQDNASMTQYNIEKAEFLLNDIIDSVKSVSEEVFPKKRKNVVLEQLKKIGENLREGSFREAGKLLMDEAIKQASESIPEIAKQLPALISILHSTGTI